MIYILAILLFVAIFAGLTIFIGWYLSVPPYKGPKSPHFNGHRFSNPSGVKAKGFKEVGKYVQTRDPGKWFRITESTPAKPIQERIQEGIKIHFVNHSTFLIQMEGINILTDPVWSHRISPFSFAGPARLRPVGIRFEDLPKIDIVVVSHNHYDHMDIPTLKKLKKHSDPEFFVSLGNKAFMLKKGFSKTQELDWHQSLTCKGLKITATPAQHFSSRGFFDRNKTHWCGFVLENEKQSVYYVGDTGYGEFFKEIGDHFGGFDVALIPIGAWRPVWFMGPIHCSPPQAVEIFRHIMASHMIPCHYGTFPLADDGMFESIDMLKEVIEKESLSDRIHILKEGEDFSLGE